MILASIPTESDCHFLPRTFAANGKNDIVAADQRR